MKKIYSTVLSVASIIGEYEWCDMCEEPCGEEWDGDVLDYVENLSIDDGCEIKQHVGITIHNEPANPVFVVMTDECGTFYQMFWAEEKINVEFKGGQSRNGTHAVNYMLADANGIELYAEFDVTDLDDEAAEEAGYFELRDEITAQAKAAGIPTDTLYFYWN